ncbi:hypothetical protein TRIP_C60390 [Candidatus Zixiibacteriota bacterium]|nr:hypothetical protein TRIP_C60390 [candidate division Zixibacteria bacterium]
MANHANLIKCRLKRTAFLISGTKVVPFGGQIGGERPASLIEVLDNPIIGSMLYCYYIYLRQKNVNNS